MPIVLTSLVLQKTTVMTVIPQVRKLKIYLPTFLEDTPYVELSSARWHWSWWEPKISPSQCCKTRSWARLLLGCRVRVGSWILRAISNISSNFSWGLRYPQNFLPASWGSHWDVESDLIETLHCEQTNAPKKAKHTYSLIGNVNIEAQITGWVSGSVLCFVVEDNTQIFGSLCSVRKLLERIWYAADVTYLRLHHTSNCQINATDAGDPRVFWKCPASNTSPLNVNVNVINPAH